VRKYSRKTHMLFIIRDWVSAKPLQPLIDKIKQLISKIVSKECVELFSYVVVTCNANICTHCCV
jgi:hypothetical protein